MVIERLLGEIPKTVFLDEHFLRLPFSLPKSAAEFTELGTWRTVESILSQPDPDVLVVKEGRRWEEERVPSYPEARRLADAGYTLLVRHAERHDPGLADLAQRFQNDFHAPADVHLYCTPANEHGFGWHYDAEDVFILQTAGSKEFSLRKNTVNPWPLVETLPVDMKFEREIMPLMKCLLKAGDWLYIPNGYWHVAEAREPSISLAVGLMTTTALDVFDFLRHRLLSSMMWRQRLPVPGEASGENSDDLVEQYRALFSQLGEDLARAFDDEAFLRSFLASRKTPS